MTSTVLSYLTVKYHNSVNLCVCVWTELNSTRTERLSFTSKVPQNQRIRIYPNIFPHHLTAKLLLNPTMALQLLIGCTPQRGSTGQISGKIRMVAFKFFFSVIFGFVQPHIFSMVCFLQQPLSVSLCFSRCFSLVTLSFQFPVSQVSGHLEMNSLFSTYGVKTSTRDVCIQGDRHFSIHHFVH